MNITTHPKIRPALFNSEMVKAILNGTKTQTRRVCKHQYWQFSELVDVNKNGITQKVGKNVSCPFGNVGDILWVRETWFDDPMDGLQYKTDRRLFSSFGSEIRWKPSIHMPKEACRLLLEITDVRVERLGDISDKDAIAEGVERGYCSQQGDGPDLVTYKNYITGKHEFITAKESFKTLWESINGPESWNLSPFVWIVSFKQAEKPENFLTI